MNINVNKNNKKKDLKKRYPPLKIETSLSHLDNLKTENKLS